VIAPYRWSGLANGLTGGMEGEVGPSVIAVSYGRSAPAAELQARGGALALTPRRGTRSPAVSPAPAAVSNNSADNAASATRLSQVTDSLDRFVICA
jgi:hypothetical protein